MGNWEENKDKFKVGDRVIALDDYLKPGVKKGMTGTIIKWQYADIMILWDQMTDDYPEGVFHYNHHPDYIFGKLE